MREDQPSPVSHPSDESAWRANSLLSVCSTRANRVTPFTKKSCQATTVKSQLASAVACAW